MTELPFNDNDFINEWHEWEKYRKERRLPKYTERGLQRTFTMLKNISGNNKDIAIKIINQSMEQNYQGLFPLKNNGTNRQTPGNNKPAGTSEARINRAKNW